MRPIQHGTAIAPAYGQGGRSIDTRVQCALQRKMQGQPGIRAMLLYVPSIGKERRHGNHGETLTGKGDADILPDQAMARIDGNQQGKGSGV